MVEEEEHTAEKHEGDVTPQHNLRRAVKNLQSLQEEHLNKKKNSIIYQFLDSGRRSATAKKSPENVAINPQNIFKSMASMLRKEQLTEKDAKIYHVERWM